MSSALEPNPPSADAPRGRVRCIVVTPERAVLDEAAELVILPMIDGELGVQYNRTPLIGRLGAGELRLTGDAGVKRFFVEAGFVQVRANVVTVLTAQAESSAAVTPERAAKAETDADALPATTAVARANKAKARDRAQGMKRVAAKNPAA